MAKVYYRKIKEQEINQNTGEVWCLEDVPRRWRETVKGLLVDSGCAELAEA